MRGGGGAGGGVKAEFTTNQHQVGERYTIQVGAVRRVTGSDCSVFTW